MRQVFVPLDLIVDGGLWRLFPCIEVGKTKDIPGDYPGPIGVPITALDKIQGDARFEILDSIRPKIGGRQLYRRVVIRNTCPELPDIVDINALLEACGSDYEIDINAIH